MYSKVLSSAVTGVSGTKVYVEADIHDGLPTFSMVGYLSSSVREAGERVRTALKNSGYILPAKRITVNLSPADLKKDGSSFDLPIAVAILLAMGITPVRDISNTLILGELSLNGDVKPVTGVLPMVHHAKQNGVTSCIIPKENVEEAALIDGVEVIGIGSVTELTGYLDGSIEIPAVSNLFNTSYQQEQTNKVDFADVKGQAVLKRGMEIAAAGFHNVLMTGAAGAGKSMIAKCLPTIMPKLSTEESIEVTKIYSISGLLPDKGKLITARPFRSPHHTVSNRALTGGGSIPRPGEVSLAHNGVLFLDELPEFAKSVLEVLRQPMEDRQITISRVNAAYSFPADFMLVAAMNPCPCGYYPDMRRCRCTPDMIRRYQGKISGPLTDRIDITMEVKPLTSDELFSESDGERSEDIRLRVEAARERQRLRYKDEALHFNSQLEGKLIKKYIRLDAGCEALIKEAFETMDLSARGAHRVLKLARTIADLAESDEIREEYIKEALFFRMKGVSDHEQA